MEDRYTGLRPLDEDDGDHERHHGCGGSRKVREERRARRDHARQGDGHEPQPGPAPGRPDKDHGQRERSHVGILPTETKVSAEVGVNPSNGEVTVLANLTSAVRARTSYVALILESGEKIVH